MKSPPASTFPQSPAVAAKSNPFVLLDSDSQSNLLHSQSLTDAQALRLLKEQWISGQLRDRRSEYTHCQPVSIFTGTWNVNGKLCSENLQPYLLYSGGGEGAPADLYFIGFQEVDLSAEAFLLNDTAREEYWEAIISKCLSLSGRQYVKLVSRQLAGILMFAYCVDHLRPHVSDVCTDIRGCGVLGFGNKGAVGIRLQIYNSSLCVINSHLAADSSMVERRNADYEYISRTLSFTPSSAQASSSVLDTSTSSPRRGGSYSIWDCDTLVWMGDLNYRVALPDFQVKAMLDTRSYSVVLKHDQLVREQSYEGGAFCDFDEAPITFAPSYKYDPGTNTFDTSEKRRTPSWCDRVLYRHGDPIRALKYDCIHSILTSDHKPVVCLFEADFTEVDLKRFNEVNKDILRNLDRMENDAMPDCKLNINSLNFGDIRYLEPVHRDIVLENVGGVIARARFVPKLDEKRVCRDWMWINPPMSVVMPKDKLTIRLTVHVDEDAAPALNVGDDQLEDILILHLENGKDFFISISGSYSPTCFGMPIQLLSHLPRPVLKMKGDIPKIWKQLQSKESMPATSSLIENTQQVPKELWRIVDYIYKYGLGYEGLFLTSGEQHYMREIRLALDSGADFRLPSSFRSQASTKDAKEGGGDAQEQEVTYIHSMAESLLAFLTALPDPVIPFGVHYQKCIDASSSFSLAKHAISLLPTPHYNVFVYITSFLREIVETSSGKISAETLAAVFASPMLRTPKPVKSKYNDAVSSKKTAFILHFLHAKG
eukprot:Partr_v1_DN27507_c0_g1_i1_m30757 putative Synaptojanin